MNNLSRLLSSSRPFLAPDDGAGSGSSVSGGAAPVGGAAAVAGPGGPATAVGAGETGPASRTDKSDDLSYDGLVRRVADMEVEIDALKSAPKPAAVGAVSGDDAKRLDRIERVLGPIFGRDFAEYDAEQQQRDAAATGTGNKAL